MMQIERDIPSQTRMLWKDQLFEPTSGSESLIDFIGEAPGKYSPTMIEREFTKVETLQALGVARYPTDALSSEHQHMYARRITQRRPTRFRGTREPRRTLEVVSFLRHSLAEHTDTFIDLTDRRVAQLWRRARDKARVEGSSTSANTFVERVRGVLAGETNSKTAVDQVNVIRELLSDFDRGDLKPPCLAVRQREILASQSSQIRPLLKMLLALELKRDDLRDFSVDLDAWREAYKNESPWLTPDLVKPESQAWRKLLSDPNPRRAFCAAEALLLWELRQALRGGRVHVPHSESHRSLQAVLKTGSSTVKAAHSDIPAETFLQGILDDLTAALDRLAIAVDEGHVRIDGRDLPLHPLAAEEAPSGFKSLRAELYAELPAISLAEIMLKIDAEVHYSWILLGRAPRTERELLFLYTALLGHAMDVGPQRLTMIVPALDQAGIAEALLVLEDSKALRQANDAIVEYLRDHPITTHWGRDVDCASDAMSLDVSRSISTARLDPRRKHWGTAVYGHVLGHYGIGHGMPLPLMTRQDGAAIEGALRMRIVIIDRVMTDTHGQTAFGMSLGKRLRFDLCPRLKSLKDRRLHVPRGFSVPETLKDLAIRDVSMEDIETGFADFAALADGVAAGKLSAVTACQRHGAGARTRKAYKAGRPMGLLLRSIHMCLTATNDPFRREQLRLINHGELVHGLQRQIRRAGFATRRGMRREELIAQPGSLTLVTNAILACNTHALQTIVDRRGKEGRPVRAEELRHFSPTPFEHINFVGAIHFPVHLYRDRILAPAHRRAAATGA